MGAIFKFMQAGVDKGKVAPLDLDRVRANLRGTTELRDLAGCDLVIEAVPEKLDLKRALWGEVDGACQAEAIFASPTSGLSIAEMGTFVQRPARLVRLRFCDPRPLR